MCGIAGAFGWTNDVVLDAMLDDIVHRGPDECGTFFDSSAPLMMGARRLSIVDLENGSQPISNEDGSVVAVFNGEIYNHDSLRQSLESRGHKFKTQCDTEVLVHLWEEYGDDFPQYLNGMFAFSIWDADEEVLFLARDRLGIKPLYVAEFDERFLWGSNLQSLLTAGVEPELDEQAVYNHLRLRYTPASRTLVSAVSKIKPGTSLTVTDKGVKEQTFWQATDYINSKDPADPAGQIRTIFEDSVQKRLMSDVPLGVFLSGGLDSSAVVALMSQYMDEPVRTFSVGFAASEVDESAEAQFVADYFGTDHHEIEVDISSMSVFDDLIRNASEPIADPAILPTLLLSEFANTEVKTVLTGEGADELFAGYHRYSHMRDRHRSLRRVPRQLYQTAQRLAGAVGVYDDKLNRNAVYLEEEELLFKAATRFRTSPASYLATSADDTDLRELVTDVSERVDGSTIEKMFAYDISYWLPDNLLYKVDHASMHHSLEARVPFLDHRLVELAMSISPDTKLSGQSNKPVLKQSVNDLVPDRTLNRSKHGFEVPVAQWFRSDYEPIAKWLTESRIDAAPYVDASRVFALWNEHKSGDKDHSGTLWSVLTYVSWYHLVIQETDKMSA